MEAGVCYERNVSIDDVVNEFDQIWADWNKAKLRNASVEARASFLATSQTTHRELATAYPIALKWLCSLGEYHPKVLRLWLQKIQHNMWKDSGEYLDAQTDYLVRLYKHYNPRAHYKVVGEYRTSIRAALEDEWKEFQKSLEEVKSKANDIDAELRAANRAELAEYLAEVGEAAVRLGGTVRVESEITGAAPTIPEVVANNEYRPRGCSYSAADLLASH